MTIVLLILFIETFLISHSQTSLPFSCFEIDNNNGSVCSKGGYCVNDDECYCLNNTQGNNCELEPNGGGRCQCDTDDPIIFQRCYSTVGHGFCDLHGSEDCGDCVCFDGSWGSNCQFFNCFGIHPDHRLVCSNHGSCTERNNCQCQENYAGNECELWDCYGLNNTDSGVCSGHGICIDIDSCECEDCYTENECEIPPSPIDGNVKEILEINNPTCFGVSWNQTGVCSRFGKIFGFFSFSRGICVTEDTCLCYCGFYGEKCQNVDFVKWITKCR